MIISFVEKSWNDYNQWVIDDKKIFKRIQRLIKETTREPFSGIGKPERTLFPLITHTFLPH